MATTAPERAAAMAAPIVWKCVASGADVGLTKRVAPAGGKAPAQLPTGWHVLWPSSSIVAPAQSWGGRTSLHPHPDGSGAKPAGHCVAPTGLQPVDPSEAIVPAGQSVEAAMASQPIPSGNGWNPALHAM